MGERQQRWAVTASERGRLEDLNKRDRFLVRTPETEMPVEVDRRGEPTGRWMDGVTGVPEDIMDLAREEEEPFSVTENDYADGWIDVMADANGDFVRQVEVRVGLIAGLELERDRGHLNASGLLARVTGTFSGDWETVEREEADNRIRFRAKDPSEGGGRREAVVADVPEEDAVDVWMRDGDALESEAVLLDRRLTLDEIEADPATADMLHDRRPEAKP